MDLNSEQVAIQRDRGAIMSELKAQGAKFKGDNCTCIFHEDSTPSAIMKQGSDGVYRLTCFVCLDFWDVFDIRAKVRGCSLGDVLKEVQEYVPLEKPKPTVYASLETIVAHYPNVETVYKYSNPDTSAVELAVIRYRKENRKGFAQCSPVSNGWIAGRPQGKLPLYNRTRVRDSKVIICVEGEKAVHALAEAGHVATTSPMGAGKAKEADWSPLKDKRVYLWPDNDPVDAKSGKSTGIEHMKEVQRILEPLGCALFWIEPADLELEPKGDAADLVASMAGGKLEDKKLGIQMALDDARPLGAAQELEERMGLMIQGKWVNLQWPWPYLTEQAQALLPGMVTALCGDPGGAKSFLVLEAFVHWHVAGEKVALFMLEDDRTYHLHRVLAQLEGNSNLTDSAWVQAHPDEARESFANQRDLLNTFGRVLYDAPESQITLTDCADWFESQSQQGVSICGLDPVTAASASEKPWIEDQKFIFRVKAIAKRYGTRLLYTIHPRIQNGKAGPALSRLAGGAAYARFSHSVLWLTRHDNPVTTMVFSREMGMRNVSYERGLKIAKARNGKGTGSELALHLNTGTLRMEEYGIVMAREESARQRKQQEHE